MDKTYKINHKSKRNKSKRNKSKRNKSKRNKSKRNKSKRNKSKRNKSTRIHSIIDNSLYPFWYRKIPFPQVLDNKELLDEKTWNKQLELASNLYKDKSSLPKGTILFHGSGIINPIANLRLTDEPFFFGLDAFIAIWYISEYANKRVSDFQRLLRAIEGAKIHQEKNIEQLIEFDTSKWSESELDKMRTNYNDKIKKIVEDQNKFMSSLNVLKKSSIGFNNRLENFSELLSDLKLHNRRYYFLNIYETQENIHYKYLADSILDQNPLDEEKCKKIACMHPQFGYHLDELEPPVELSIEFTIPANQIGNKLKLIGVYVIDVFKLNENKNKNYNEFKAIESIVLKSDFTK